MILSAQHRMANNFSVLANWTYSHCLADPSTTELTGPSYVDPNNRSADRSNCSSDHRQQVNISGVLTTPNVHSRWLGLLANGWQAAPIFHWSTGNLTTVTYGTDVALTGAGNQRAQQILANVYTAERSITNYLNINAFLAPAAAPEGCLRDHPAAHRFRSERDEHRPGLLAELQDSGTPASMQFRAEAFNLTNSVMFGPPTGALNSANFGRISPQIQSSAPGTTSTARIMQFAIKYGF